jgi:hypothetical protein
MPSLVKDVPSSLPVAELRSSAVKPLLTLKKNPATGMRCEVKNWLVAANQWSSIKSVYGPGSDAFLYGAFKTRKQEVRGQPIQLVDEHLAAVLGLIDFQHVARRNYVRHHDRWLRWVCETVGFNAQPCNVGTTQSVY